MQHFQMVQRFGTRVYEVEGLREPVIYCATNDLAFIRADLDDEERTRYADWLLSAALTAASSLRSP